MTGRFRLGRLWLDDGHDAEYRESYEASGDSAPASDYSHAYDFRGWSDADLTHEEGWAYYYVTSGLRRSEIHRLRAIHQEQQRRRLAADENARQMCDHPAGDDPGAQETPQS